MTSTGLTLATALLLSAGSPAADEHLLVGARLFRGGQYAEALIEFRIARKLGAAEASAYAGATLVKLERPEEAVEAFGSQEGAGDDAILDYYRALAAFQARLYQAADRLLAAVGNRSGPKIAARASELRTRIAQALAGEPSTGTIDWYLARCEEQRGLGRAALAAAYCQEATGLSTRRADHYRGGQALHPPGAATAVRP